MAKSPLQAINDRVSSAFSATAKAIAGIRRDVDQVGSEIIAKQNELAAVRGAPVPEEEIASRVDAFLLSQETEARTWFSPSSLSSVDGSGTGSGIATALNRRESALGTLCILGFRDQIRENLIREGMESTNAKPLSASQREREVKRLEAEIADLELVRERFAREAEKHGITIPRSEYADPAALLAPDREL